jgi:replicative DNA helicase
MTRHRPVAEIPPQALDIEETLLGGFLLAGAATVRALPMRVDDFLEESHRVIYGVIAALADSGRPVSEQIVADELRRHEQLDSVGGLPKLALLVERGHVESYLPEYVRRLRGLRAKRDTLAGALRIADRARNGIEPACTPGRRGIAGR